ncbi:hypothetical protein EST38_g4221 [Candolleomyces aberdarensis]|uniref:peptidylprolyl isomerase n=1 Tax=Candolleomyces aberdarensis TaxID=2316362 RepID=A0A4Q2DN44_9AGAR|nr:hypothetical protein EST38_g4221 [Candolleomyces aberdarensis]
MSVELDVWSLVLAGGSDGFVVPAADIRVTNISFGEELPDANGRSVVKLAYKALTAPDSDDEEEEEDEDEENEPKLVTTVLAALTAGKIEQSTLNVVLLEEREYVLTNTGKNTVYLTGNYIESPDQPPFGDDSDLSSDEEGYNLQDVSSDVEMDPEELVGLAVDSDASRFEEVEDEPPAKPSKRPRDTDEATEGKAKEGKEKKSKKLKAEDGKAVPAGGDKKEKKESKKEDKKKEDKKKSKSSDVKELPNGLKIQDVKVGDGPEAKKGSRVGMRYIGKFLDGSGFDKNVKGKPFYFKVGKGEVIKGWDEGIPGMRVGGERILTIPPALAYGSKGVDGIPANSTLKFEVKLLEVK